MKFSEMPYQRPSLDELRRIGGEILEKIENAADAQAVIDAYMEFDEYIQEVNTMGSLSYVRYTIDTRDEFYSGENDFYDESMPILQEASQKIDLAMLRSPFRAELEKHFGSLLFTNMEISVRTMNSEIMDLMMEENKLQSEYQKLLAGGTVEWEGEMLPLPKLGPYQQSPDRAIRRKAFETSAAWFDSHQTELDEIYDKLVRNRTAQAKALGHENYIALGYDRLGRNCYGPKEVAAFRDQIAKDMVPVVAAIKEDRRKRLGLDKLKFYDETLAFSDGNAIPEGTADEILAAGRRMYEELSEETREFAQELFGNELLDVLSKEGKAPGGYCTSLPKYKVPFIFSNFNGTSGDVDVLTHEAGHAFAFFRAMQKNYISSLQGPTIEACEVHSMSMEFLTAPWHDMFFGEATRKYEIDHCEDALIFIPYGCMVDEFQHICYENPEMTPAQRNEKWLELESKYRPWVDFDGLPFYSRGALWQRQSHIYTSPLYYIDYCMAQTVALQFWIASMKDRKDAWERYLKFVDAGGTKTFRELVECAGMKVPYAEGVIAEIGGAISRWIAENPL